MYTNTIAILNLISQRPNIRAVEISDKLDIDVDMVKISIEDHIERGHVLVDTIKAPNGIMVPAYKLDLGYVPPPLPAAPVVTPVVADPKAAARAIADARAAAQASPSQSPAKTKFDIAIAYLKRNSQVTTEQLRAAMGIKKTDHPSQFLNAAMTKGWIVRDGTYWAIGVERPAVEVKPVRPPPPERPPAPERKAGPAIPPAVSEKTQAAANTAPAPTPPTPAIVKVDIPSFVQPAVQVDGGCGDDRTGIAVGIYSDGHLTIEFGGDMLFLYPGHARELLQYLNRCAAAGLL